MKFGKLNLVLGGVFIILAAIYGFVLGMSMENLMPGGVYTPTFDRVFFRGGHTHGLLFSFFNLIVGLLVNKLALSDKSKQWLSIFAALTLCMPIGLLLRGLTYPSETFKFVVMLGGMSFIISGIFIFMGALKNDAKKTGSV